MESAQVMETVREGMMETVSRSKGDSCRGDGDRNELLEAERGKMQPGRGCVVRRGSWLTT